MQTNLIKTSLSVVMEAPVGLTASLVPGVSTTTCKGSGDEAIRDSYL